MPLSQLTVINPVSASNNDGVTGTWAAGKGLEGLAAQVHGKYYTAGYRGKVFIGTTLIAGVTLPVNTATTAITFGIVNPAGSGVNLELIALDIGWPAAHASVVGTILASMTTQVATAQVQGGVVYSNPLNASGISTSGVGLCQAILLTGATVVAITTHIPLITYSTIVDTMNPSHVDFDGKVLMAPGTSMFLTSTPAQTATCMPALSWAEWPV